MDKQVVERIQISKWCILIFFDDGRVALWLGANRVELSDYEGMRLCNALLNHYQETDSTKSA